MKKALFVDNDGSVIGGSGGSVIPQVNLFNCDKSLTTRFVQTDNLS